MIVSRPGSVGHALLLSVLLSGSAYGSGAQPAKREVLISLADASRKRGGATVLRGADARDLFVIEICGATELFRIDPDHECPQGATESGFVHPGGAPAR